MISSQPQRRGRPKGGREAGGHTGGGAELVAVLADVLAEIVLRVERREGDIRGARLGRGPHRLWWCRP